MDEVVKTVENLCAQFLVTAKKVDILRETLDDYRTRGILPRYVLPLETELASLQETLESLDVSIGLVVTEDHVNLPIYKQVLKCGTY